MREMSLELVRERIGDATRPMKSEKSWDTHGQSVIIAKLLIAPRHAIRRGASERMGFLMTNWAESGSSAEGGWPKNQGWKENP